MDWSNIVAELEYDLEACLGNNPQEYDVSDIAEVLAVVDGYNDGDAWHWILRLNDGRVVYLTGSCDFTGWDCRSWAKSTFFQTAKAAANSIVPTREELTALNPHWRDASADLRIYFFEKEIGAAKIVRDKLLEQLAAGQRKLTAREEVGVALFGNL